MREGEAVSKVFFQSYFNNASASWECRRPPPPLYSYISKIIISFNLTVDDSSKHLQRNGCGRFINLFVSPTLGVRVGGGGGGGGRGSRKILVRVRGLLKIYESYKMYPIFASPPSSAPATTTTHPSLAC